MKSLEDRIAHLETQLATQKSTESLQVSPVIFADLEIDPIPSPGLSHEAGKAFEDLITQISTDCTRIQSLYNGFGNPNEISVLQSLLSDTMTRTSWTEKESESQSLLKNLPSDNLPPIPGKEATLRLIDIYFEHSNFYSPILTSKDEFLDMIEPLYHERCSDQSYPLIRFCLLMVLGISILLLNRIDFSVSASRSEGYFKLATQLFAQNPGSTCTGDIQHLINLLLIIQYCCFASNITAAWHFLGLATRLAIELNLHKDRFATSSDPISVNARRWLFWSLYTFERNLCVIIGRPFSFSDEAIDTPFPDVVPEEPKHPLAIHLLRYRRLESEVYTTLYERKSSNWAVLRKDIWRADIHQRLLDWHASVPHTHHSSHLAPAEMPNGCLYNTLVLLYIPSRHFPAPSIGDLTILVRAATDAIDCYKKTFRDGELRFFWRTVHNLFRSGVAIVYCAQPGLCDLIPGLSPETIAATINSCSSLLWGMVERYPAGRAYRDIYDRLATSVLEQRRSNNSPHDEDAYFSTGEETNLLFGNLSNELASTLFSPDEFDALSWCYNDPSQSV